MSQGAGIQPALKHYTRLPAPTAKSERDVPDQKTFTEGATLGLPLQRAYLCGYHLGMCFECCHGGRDGTTNRHHLYLGSRYYFFQSRIIGPAQIRRRGKSPSRRCPPSTRARLPSSNSPRTSTNKLIPCKLRRACPNTDLAEGEADEVAQHDHHYEVAERFRAVGVEASHEVQQDPVHYGR